MKILLGMLAGVVTSLTLAVGDRERLTRAERQLRDFARRWRNGRFDKGNLEGAIGAIQHVLADNHLRGRERDALWERRRAVAAYAGSI